MSDMDQVDGRTQAIEAATRVICYRPAAEDIIDAALASGGVVTREDVLHEREWGNAHFADWQRERDTRQRVEVALRDLLYAKQSPVDGTCPHCGRQSCYEADSGMPLGVLRCERTGLAVIISTARGDIHQPLWDRARAALEDSDR